jgi:hypothetical protein
MKIKSSFGLLLIICIGCSVQAPHQVPVSVGESFFVHLQEGFAGELVQIYVDEKKLYEGKPITKPHLGIADNFTGSAVSANIDVTVKMPSRSIDSTLHVDLTKARGLGISILNGRVSIHQANAYGYE